MPLRLSMKTYVRQGNSRCVDSGKESVQNEATDIARVVAGRDKGHGDRRWSDVVGDTHLHTTYSQMPSPITT